MRALASASDSRRNLLASKGAHEALVPLLSSPDLGVARQAADALHNMSVRSDALRCQIAAAGALPALVALCRRPEAEDAAAAARALSNLALAGAGKWTA